MTDAPVVVTHSELNMFLSCRRKWAWYFVHDRQKPERHHGPLALGSRVHAAIEEYYKDGSDPIAAHERLAAEAVARAEADGERFIDTLYEDIIVGRNCVIAHQQWLEDTGADSNYDVEMVEEKLEAPILGGRVLLRGKVDVMFRERDSGALFISDLKTSGNWWGGQRELLERSYQHHVYLALTQLVHPETEFIGGALYTVIKKMRNLDRATGPVVERFRAPATRRMAATKLRQIEAICAEMLRVADEVRGGNEDIAYPTPQQACRYCEYKQPCELADESPRAAMDMLEREFVTGIRYKRYEETPS